jgi:glycosyltransferase involved in cell wall biosynthesis
VTVRERFTRDDSLSNLFEEPPDRIAVIASSLSQDSHSNADRSGAAPVRIAHLDTAHTLRGGQQALLTLARGLRARGYSQTIVSPAGSALAERAAAEAFPTAPLSGVLALRGLLRGFNIVHAHTARAQNAAFLATMTLPVIRVATRHVAFKPRHPRVHRLKYALTSDGIIAVSEAVRRTLIAAGIPPGRIEVIPTGVEFPADLPDDRARSAARLDWGFAEDDFVVGHLGAFTHEKGQDVALDAALALEGRLPNLRLVLGGEGPLRKSPEIQERVRRLAGRAFLPGFIADRAAFFAALDLFVMPSRSEAWGLAALEAMAYAVPVVASNTGGLPEIVSEGDTGWLVEPGDASALADAIAAAASDPASLRLIGLRARERARRFSIEETAARTEAFYRRLLEQR